MIKWALFTAGALCITGFPIYCIANCDEWSVAKNSMMAAIAVAMSALFVVFSMGVVA